MSAVTTAAYDRAALQRIAQSPIPIGAKGWPPQAEGMPASAVGTAGWQVLNGDLPFPVLVVREHALAHNLETMRRLCEGRHVLLAPHGKTTMAPQLFARQLDAGAWALTAATPAHLRVYRHLGVKRIMLANQLVEPSVIAWIAAELDVDADFELYCLVDSVEGVRLLDRELGASGSGRSLPVLLELGMRGVRCGCRSVIEARRVGREIASSRHMRLAGVEGFEGFAQNTDEVDSFLNDIEDARRALEEEGLLDPHHELISAGGSAYFDRVIERFAGTRLVLRSGCYLTHDDGMYARLSPLAGRASVSRTTRLENALEVWSVVLSRPEADLVITSMGKRDIGFDVGLPTPVRTCNLGGDGARHLRAQVQQLSDQHAHVRIDPGERLLPGDLICCTISHPCTTLDKWRVIPTVDDEYQVIGAVHTFF